jgi:predicted Rossmann fold flavoprotein
MARNHRPSRSAVHANLVAAAEAIQLPASCDICIIGAGAAGLVCAITAAEAGATVVVLEQDLRCGHTILATGNGRCNFANVALDPKHYNNPDFVEKVCGKSWLDDILGFFRDCGMRWCLEQDRLYPLSLQAASVRNVLLSRARRAGVLLAPNRSVTRLRTTQDGFDISWGAAKLQSHSLVIATGRQPLANLVCPLGLKLVHEQAVLAPLACEDSPFAVLDGRRLRGTASLYRGQFPLAQERGEVLLRSYGLSGIAIFNLSRQAKSGDIVSLDLLPDYSPSAIRQIVDPNWRGSFDEHAFDGLIDPQIASVLIATALSRWRLTNDTRVNTSTQDDSTTTNTDAMIDLVKGLPYRVKGITHPELSQIMRGGLAVEQFDPATLSTWQLPGLFACGEALNIDGDCGGFNLSWAWKSGLVAGIGAARATERMQC